MNRKSGQSWSPLHRSPIPRETQPPSDGVPDYISPIISYRVWQWDVAGLRSLKRAERLISGKPADLRLSSSRK